ncbi:MAG: hypothetical protein ACFE0Q_11595 [Anaerolineae bacterium]
MTHEEHQAQLLDDYLSALQQDSNAPIPQGIDPEMAEFARMMIGDRHSQAESSMAKFRVWEQLQKIPSQSQTETQEMEPYMKKRIEKQKRSRRRKHWMPLASVAIFTIIIGLGLAIVMLRNSNRPPVANQPQGIPNEFQLRATQLIVDATHTALSHYSTETPSVTPDPFRLTATALIENVSATHLPPTVPPLVTSTLFPTPTLIPFMRSTQDTSNASGAISATRAADIRRNCVFDGELVFRINQNQINTNETLIISGAALNPDTDQLKVEIFGGFLTEDVFQPIVEISNDLPRTEVILAQINGTDYEAGIYIVQLSLHDNRGETLSNCGLPVTFTGN